jgi:hypothetical protein
MLSQMNTAIDPHTRLIEPVRAWLLAAAPSARLSQLSVLFGQDGAPAQRAAGRAMVAAAVARPGRSQAFTSEALYSMLDLGVFSRQEWGMLLRVSQQHWNDQYGVSEDAVGIIQAFNSWRQGHPTWRDHLSVMAHHKEITSAFERLTGLFTVIRSTLSPLSMEDQLAMSQAPAEAMEANAPLNASALLSLQTEVATVLAQLKSSGLGRPALWDAVHAQLQQAQQQQAAEEQAWQAVYVSTIHGNRLYLDEPRIEDIALDDIAHHLAQICRFNGGTYTHYSVAQHSLLVASLLPPEMQLAGLMHDAAEAYLNDIVSPVKRGLSKFKALEHRVQSIIEERFGIHYASYAPIKQSDLIVLATEKRDLLPHNSEKWEELAGVVPLPQVIEPMPAEAAKHAFMEKFLELTNHPSLRDHPAPHNRRAYSMT